MAKSQLRRLQDALIEATMPGRTCVRAGAFLLMLTPSDPLVWLNYAMPVEEPGDDDVKRMVEAFRRHDRMPRLEFAQELWPSLPELLERHGFVLDSSQPVMELQAGDWRPYAHRHAVRLATPDDALVLNQVAGAAFGHSMATDDAIRSTAENLAAGRTLAALVESEGRAIAVGFAVGSAEVREVAGIGTLPEFRRQGAASAVIDRLLREFFGKGGELAWLSAGDDGAKSVYAKLGFRDLARQVCYGMPES